MPYTMDDFMKIEKIGEGVSDNWYFCFNFLAHFSFQLNRNLWCGVQGTK